MKGLGYWLTGTMLVLTVMVVACGAPSAPAPGTETPVTAPAAQKPAAPAAVSLEEAARKEGEVVVWAHSFQDSDQFVKFFKEKYPYLDLKIWNATSNEVINKALEEAKVGRFSADIVTLTDRDIIKLKDLFLAYEWPATKGWDEVSRPSHNFWRYYVRSAKLPAYNTTLVSAAEAPKTLDDLKDPKWRGRSITSFSNNELPLVYAYQWRQDNQLNWDKSFAFWKQVFENTRPRGMTGFEGAMGLVAAGEVVLHQMTASSTFFRYLWRGAPVAIVPLAEIPSNAWAVGVIKNAPHPNAARLFADFFTSPAAQTVFANTQGAIAASPEAAKTAKPNLALAEKELKPFTIPPELFTTENVTKAQEFWTMVAGIR